MDFTNPAEGEIKARHDTLAQTRSQPLSRGYKYSKITIPYLLPENEDTGGQDMQLDYSTVGAEYVNHLANVYLDEMFPSHRCFFKLQMPIEQLLAAAQSEATSITDIEKGFSLAEKEARWRFEQRHARIAVLDFLKQLIVGGNSCLYFPPEGMAQNYALDQYVLWRDTSGKILEIITVDKKALMSFDTELRAEIMRSLDDITSETDLSKYQVDIYTYIRRDPENPKVFLVDQAVENTPIGDQVTYTEELLPWIPCAWNRVRREVYGRGLVEDHYGSFYALSVLVEALVTAGAICTDFKFLVKPGSVLDVVEMNNSASGTYHYGNPDDVASIDLGKTRELQFVAGLVDNYKKDLGKVFLVLSTQIRDSERTTAEENRLRAAELNKAHGGVFGNLSLTCQRPIATLLLRDIDVILGDSGIEPVIMTGLDAMGRMSENEKIRYAFDDMALLNNVPEELRARFKIANLISTILTGRDIDADILMTEEEFQEMQQAQQQAQEQQMAGEELLKKADSGDIAAGMQGE